MRFLSLFVLSVFCFSCQNKTQFSPDNPTIVKKDEIGEAFIYQMPGSYSVDQAREILLEFIDSSVKTVNRAKSASLKGENIVAMLFFTHPNKPSQFSSHPFLAACESRNGVLTYSLFKWSKQDPAKRGMYRHLFEWGIKPYEALDTYHIESYDVAKKIALSTENRVPHQAISQYAKELEATLKWKSINTLEILYPQKQH